MPITTTMEDLYLPTHSQMDHCMYAVDLRFAPTIHPINSSHICDIDRTIIPINIAPESTS